LWASFRQEGALCARCARSSHGAMESGL